MEGWKLGLLCATVAGCEVGGEPNSGFNTVGDSATWPASGSTTVGETTSQTGDPDLTTGVGTSGSASDTSETSEPSETTGGPPASDCPVLLPWTTSAPFLDGDGHAHPLPAFAVGDRFYVHTVINDQRRLRLATFDGATLGPWSDASANHGGGPHGFAAVPAGDVAYHFRNGHIAQYVFDNAGIMVGDVELIEESTKTAFGGDLFVWDTALSVEFEVGPSWLLHLGGFSFSPYDYRQNVRRNTLPPGPVFVDTGATHPGSRPGKSAAFVPPGSETSFIYTTQTGGREMWRATFNAAGELGAWQALAPIPDGTGNERGDMFVVGRSLFAIRGAAVFRATLADDGTMTEWEPMPSLPSEQVDEHWGDGHTEGPTWGVVDSHVLIAGPEAVFISSLDRTLDCP